jgi:ferric-dicitrate binding protein FerR (iron transport regulator)
MNLHPSGVRGHGDGHRHRAATVGWILMIVGALGLVVSLLSWSSWGPRRRTGVQTRDDVNLLP